MDSCLQSYQPFVFLIGETHALHSQLTFSLQFAKLVQSNSYSTTTVETLSIRNVDHQSAVTLFPYSLQYERNVFL